MAKGSREAPGHGPQWPNGRLGGGCFSSAARAAWDPPGDSWGLMIELNKQINACIVYIYIECIYIYVYYKNNQTHIKQLIIEPPLGTYRVCIGFMRYILLDRVANTNCLAEF